MSQKIKELIKKPKNRQKIDEAIRLQNRIAFHSMYNNNNTYKKEFANWCKTLIDVSKHNLFDRYFTTPHQNINFVSTIYEQYKKIFNSRNAFFNYSFKNTDHSKDFKKHLLDIKDLNFWRTTGFEAFKNNYNSIIVITAEQENLNYFLLDINNVWDISDTEDVEYLIYKKDKNTFVSYDETSIITWDTKGNIIESIDHGLGFCPANWFWNENQYNDSFIVKHHPLTDSLGSLDWLLFAEISKNHTDLYSLYPIMTTYSTDCDYTDSSGAYCNNGYLVKDIEGKQTNLYSGDTPQECPICGTSQMTGAGTRIVAPAPNENEADLLDGVKFVTIPSDSLKLIQEKIDLTKVQIYTNLTGRVKDLTQSVNEKQIISSNSDRENILTNLAYVFSLAQKSANDMMAQIMYDDFNGSDVSYGDKFYIYTVDELSQFYLEAIDKGMNESQLQSIRINIIETENKTNINELERKLMILALEPLPYIKDKSELISLVENGIVSKIDATIQNYFMYFLAEFELNNGSLILFQKDKQYNKRIETIKEELVRMASQKSN